LGNFIAQRQHSSSPGLIERPSIPERTVNCGLQHERRGVLDAPVKPGHDERKL
jgi:hypothetical protein